MLFYCGGPKRDVTASTVFPVFGLPFDPLLALDLAVNFFFSVCSVRTDRGAAVNGTALIAGAAVSGGACAQSTSSFFIH
jgi:hypothetical protein